ncbi:MAG TPA: ketoacyl-ACP synthase III family protein [Streptosporangiaceae bacterium]|jgi:3-oxoacyl-[acyl-carrier-protein] synthase-3
MHLDDLFIAGLGSWLPPAVDVAEAVADGRYDPADHAANEYLSITVAGDEAPPDMAVRAGRQALARSGVPPHDIALLLHASLWYQGVDFWPAASYIHHRVVGEAPHGPAMDVHQMSNGSMAALELAASYLAADPGRRAALVTSADRLALPGFDRWRSDLRGIVYGDGAGAVVLARSGFARLRSVVSVSDSTLEGMYRGRQAFGAVPGHAGQPVDNRTRRADFAATADTEALGRRILSGVTEAVERALADADSKLADIGWAVFPNLGADTLRRSYLQPLGLDLAATAWEWGRHTGHVGAADQIIGLANVAGSGRVAPGDRALLVGIGAGFSWTCAVVEFVSRPDLT